MNQKLAHYVLDQLAAWGVQRVYGVAGDAILPLISAMAQRNVPAFVPARHEEAAAFMAKAEAMLTGSVGVCTATSGPGAAHLVNGLADAQTDSVPVLAITGQQESFYAGTVHKQVIDQPQLLAAVTEYSAGLAHPAGIAAALSRALRIAVARKKAVHLSVPKDFWNAEVPAAAIRTFEPYLKTPARSAPHVIDGALALLRQAERPAILVGIGARQAVGDVLRLAEALRAPVIHTLAAAGQFPRRHHLVMGSVGEGGTEHALGLIADADCVLRLGTTWWPKRYLPQPPVTIDVNIEPEHVGMGSPAGYGVVGPIEEILPHLISGAPTWPRPEWEARVFAAKQALEETVARELEEAKQSNRTVHPALIVNALCRRIPEAAVICLDVGDHVLWFNRYFHGTGRQDVLVSGYWRTMGFALPAAIAASLCAPQRPAIAVAGDGGISMSLAELLTAVRLRLPVKIVVFNNRSLAMEENEMKALGMNVHGVGLNNPGFDRIAENCGLKGFRVERHQELDHVLEQAFAADGPALVDVVTSPVPVPSPKPRVPEGEPVFA